MPVSNNIKFIIFILIATLITITSNAANGPFPTWLDRLTGVISFGSDGQASLATPSGERVYPHQVARFVYDVSVDGGSVGAHTLETSLPAKAVLKSVAYYHDTQFDSTGGGTVAISCEDANNIVSAINLDQSSTAGNFYNGAVAPGSTAGQFIKNIAAACTITATVASTAQSAGKLVGWVEYYVQD